MPCGHRIELHRERMAIQREAKAAAVIQRAFKMVCVWVFILRNPAVVALCSICALHAVRKVARMGQIIIAVCTAQWKLKALKQRVTLDGQVRPYGHAHVPHK